MLLTSRPSQCGRYLIGLSRILYLPPSSISIGLTSCFPIIYFLNLANSPVYLQVTKRVQIMK